MQTFLPYADFAESASVLDRSRLGKQRVENLQIMQALTGLKLITSDKIPVYADGVLTGKVITVDRPESDWTVEESVKKGWANHPAVSMWRGYENAFIDYQWAVTGEWLARGYKDTCYLKTRAVWGFADFPGTGLLPRWLGDEKFHASHRSNLLRKDVDWYSQFGWSEPDDLPYVWPV